MCDGAAGAMLGGVFLSNFTLDLKLFAVLICAIHLGAVLGSDGRKLTKEV
jgi:hypothetical protein